MQPHPASDVDGQHSGKLVRDRILEIIRATGQAPIVTTLTEERYRQALRRKLGEEASEVAAAGDANLLDELADVYEVLLAIVMDAGATLDKIAAHAARGGFDRWLWLAAVQ
jgi:predicted house-cleaning noncanonical NTP pyrophosphatase (MazG superfamily)